MKKNQKSRLLPLLLTVLCLIFSCHKDGMIEDLKVKNFNKEMVSQWLNAHDKNLSTEEKILLNLLSLSLNYDAVETLPRNNNDNIIIIPIDERVKKYLKVDERSALSLIIIQSKTGKLRWSTIVSYKANDNKQSKLSKFALQKILNNEKLPSDGAYKFFNVLGRLLYEMTYAEGNLHSFSNAIKASDLSGKNKGINQSKKSVVPSGDPICIDWYWMTTVYDNAGNVIEYYETFLYTTCSDTYDSGGGVTPEDPIDQEIDSYHSEFISETEYTEDDNTAQIGEANNATSATQVQYKVGIHIKRMAITRTLISIEQYDVTAHPSNLQYYSYTTGNTLRVVTPITTSRYWTPSDPLIITALCTWEYTAVFRYTYLDLNITPKTRSVTGTRTVFVNPLM